MTGGNFSFKQRSQIRVKLAAGKHLRVLPPGARGVSASKHQRIAAKQCFGNVPCCFLQAFPAQGE
jgi:hypothetical protein